MLVMHTCRQHQIRRRAGANRQLGECGKCHAWHWRPLSGGEWRPEDTYLPEDPEDLWQV